MSTCAALQRPRRFRGPEAGPRQADDTAGGWKRAAGPEPRQAAGGGRSSAGSR